MQGRIVISHLEYCLKYLLSNFLVIRCPVSCVHHASAMVYFPDMWAIGRTTCSMAREYFLFPTAPASEDYGSRWWHYIISLPLGRPGDSVQKNTL